MASPDRPGLDDPAREGLEDWPRPRDGGGIAADHHVERSFPGVLRGAAQGRVDHRDALGREFRGKAPRRRRFRSRAVDNQEGFAGRSEPVGALDDGFNLRRAGDAQDDRVALFGEGAQARRLLRAATP